MLKKLILFPFGGNSREALLTILALNKTQKEWDVVGFIDDDPQLTKKNFLGVPVLGNRTQFKKNPNAWVLAVPGNQKNYLKRKEIIDSLNIPQKKFATIIHPSVTISPDAEIGYNTLIMPNTVISCGVKIAKHCVILSNTTISHDTVVGDYTCIGSNVAIAGFAKIGSSCYIGSGVSIRNHITIHDKALVGLGAVVVKDVSPQKTVVGNPARELKPLRNVPS